MIERLRKLGDPARLQVIVEFPAEPFTLPDALVPAPDPCLRLAGEGEEIILYRQPRVGEKFQKPPRGEDLKDIRQRIRLRGAAGRVTVEPSRADQLLEVRLRQHASHR